MVKIDLNFGPEDLQSTKLVPKCRLGRPTARSNFNQGLFLPSWYKNEASTANPQTPFLIFLHEQTYHCKRPKLIQQL